MSDFIFKLTPAYCLYNGVAVKEQHGCKIFFIIENFENEILKNSLRRAFDRYLEDILLIDGCPSEYQGFSQIDFVEGKREEIRNYVSGLFKSNGENLPSLQENDNNSDEAAAVILLESILSEARKENATDIHIEKNCVKFRMKGMLKTHVSLLPEKTVELVQRIKLLAGMNVLEKRKSQDGHFVHGNSNPLFLRVSTIPVIGKEYSGDESLVIRLLDTARVPLAIDSLGFNQTQMEKIKMLEGYKCGLVVVCGPTGSGKSTTVASILLEIQKKMCGQLKIISLEDPPEYVIPGVSQIHAGSQENGDKCSFSESLDHIFRQDPDVIMIGEIRDETSANAALRAALTGHLVFATLHTGSAAESILRLENLGLDRDILASVLQGVICQELNYFDEKVRLYADIAIPNSRFIKSISVTKDEDSIDQLMEHFTNYSEIFDRTLAVLTGRNQFSQENAVVLEAGEANFVAEQGVVCAKEIELKDFEHNAVELEAGGPSVLEQNVIAEKKSVSASKTNVEIEKQLWKSKRGAQRERKIHKRIV